MIHSMKVYVYPMIHSRLNQEATKGIECDKTSTQGYPQQPKSM